MNNHNYPIVLGHRFKKGLIVLRHGEGLSVLICRLKRDCETGERFDFEDVKNIEQKIWFADREAVQTTIDALNDALKGLWEANA